MTPINASTIRCPNLNPTQYATLLTTVIAVDSGACDATVSLTYLKQTKTRPRIAGEDYVPQPGVSCETQTGQLRVLRRVDNKANRKAGVVGRIYFKVKSSTRADGVTDHGYTNIRPEGITAFALLGVSEPSPQPQGA